MEQIKLIYNGLLLVYCYYNNSFADDTLFVPTEQREIVREYIEELVASMIGGGSLDNVPIGQLYNDLECEFILFVFLAIDINFIWEISALINDSVRLHFPLYCLKNYPLSGFVYQYIYRCIIELMHPLKSVYRIHTLYQMS